MIKYWKSIEEIRQGNDSLNKREGQSYYNNPKEDISCLNIYSRRDFLWMSGFSLAAATLAASCEAPAIKAIPYVIKPEEIISGVANYYASSLIDGNDYCSILVKTREGRPIKIEGNVLSDITRGGTSARVQASVLSLYDTERLQNPVYKKNKTTWDRIDTTVKQMLKSINGLGGKIIILSSSIISPSTQEIYKDFINTYPNTRVVYYDSISAAAILMANEITFSQKIIPSYRFDKADVIVSFGADFLGTWLSPVEFTKQYVVNRKLDNKKTMSRHIQFETGMSLTGSNADERYPIKPSDEGILLTHLYKELKELEESAYLEDIELPFNIKSIAKELWENKGKSLVVSGTNDVYIQTMVNTINFLLQNYGNTIDLNVPFYLKQGIDEEMKLLVNEMNKGIIDVLIINNVNPVYDYPESSEFINGLNNLKLSISLSGVLDETSALVNYVCPDNHFLESWNDAEPKKGFFSLCQPVINKLFNTRSAQESLLIWIGNNISYHDYIQHYWEKNIYPLTEKLTVDEDTGFRQFWIKCVQDGVFEVPGSRRNKIRHTFNNPDIQSLIDNIQNQKFYPGEHELQLYESIAIGNGKQSNNPWLQELPDPISKVCWDNYAAISPDYASKNNLKNGDLIKFDAATINMELPVLIQPGQAINTTSIALGYGRKNAGKVGNNVGQNVFQLAKFRNGSIQYNRNEIKLIKTDKEHALALTQTHHSMEGRAIVRETTLDNYLKNPSSGNEVHVKVQKESVSLYKELVHIGYHWSLSIDLNSCTGCGNCVIACQAENNVPVIGKEEVRKRRIMHWIRIDRYYSNSVDNPMVYHQPVMCQHCNNAPCENVCPVSATMHSDDGLNHMTYNRCIGTRYCMNNCPYKVRRFNWYAYHKNKQFDFYMNSDYGRMVLNPDVTVRSRGVVEKCSLCIQRIQEAKFNAKLENRLLADDDVKPACLQSCPADAIVFGNRNNKESEISKKFQDNRNYHLLEEIHSLPSVGYLVKVRNRRGKEI